MKRKFVFIIVCFCFATVAAAQTKLDSLKALGRDSLIKLAIKKINDPKFIPANYDVITVKANQTTLLVEFDLSIRLITTNACYFDQVTVALFGNGTGESITGDCEMPDYYNPTMSQKKKVSFVFDAINKSDEIGHIPGNKLDKGETMVITENPAYYEVEVSDWSTYTRFKVDKINGKISEVLDKDYAREGEQKDNFVEIK